MTHGKAGELGADVRFPPPLVALGMTLAGVAIGYARGPILFQPGLWTRLVGIAIVIGGLAFAVAARTWFVRTGQSPIPWKPSPELIVRGPYRFTRNPMYVGLTLVQAGLGLAVGNAWIVLLAPVSLLIVHIIAVLPEERYLEQKFGQSYRDYCARVGRYL